MTTDAITDAHTDVSLTVDLPVRRCWELVTDVGRAAQASPECVAADWLDTEHPGPRTGARFFGRNEFGNGMRTEVTCVVTEAEAPHRFAWAVLDGSAELERAQSIWRYELTSLGERRTRIRHGFTHGSGDSYIRTVAPDQLGARLTELRHNMSATLSTLLDIEPEEISR